MDQPVKNLGVRVTAAAVGINLALGILYTWSVIKKSIPDDWNWSDTDKSWPYSVACLVFAFMMVPAGRLQDKIGPRIVATIGGLLVGLGMVLASFASPSCDYVLGFIPFADTIGHFLGITPSALGYVLGFGLLAGTGIGFGYAAATPPAVKWFPAARTGMIAGIVVSGFGLASAYAAPLATWLIGTYGIPTTMLALGVAFLIVVVGLAQLLMPPPKGYVPAGAVKAMSPGAASVKDDFAPVEMLSTIQFFLLWFMYACGAGAGLMIISNLATIAKRQAGQDLGFVLVAALAIGNGAGRILAGSLSDKLGRKSTLVACFLFQATLMLLLSMANQESIRSTAPLLANVPLLCTMPALAVISALIGANYGANLSLFPSITKEYYGLRNFGVNYGLVFTAWGVGGFALSQIAAKLYKEYEFDHYAYYLAAGLLVLAAGTTFAVRRPHVEHRHE